MCEPLVPGSHTPGESSAGHKWFNGILPKLLSLCVTLSTFQSLGGSLLWSFGQKAEVHAHPSLWYTACDCSYIWGQGVGARSHVGLPQSLIVQSIRKVPYISILAFWGPPLLRCCCHQWESQDCMKNTVQGNGVLGDPFPTSWVRSRGLPWSALGIMPISWLWVVLKLSWEISEGSKWWTYYQFDSTGLLPQSYCYYLLFRALK